MIVFLGDSRVIRYIFFLDVLRYLSTSKKGCRCYPYRSKAANLNKSAGLHQNAV